MHAFAALLVLAPFQGPMSFGSSGVEDFILTEKQAYMVLPPQAVGVTQTMFMSWSPSGRYLLMGRLNPPITTSALNTVLSGGRPQKPAMALFVWDKTQNRTSELGSIPIESGREITWLAGKDVTLNVLTQEIDGGEQERVSLLRIDASNSKLSLIPIANPVPPNTFYRVETSPLSPHAVIIETSFTRERNALPQVTSFVWAIDDQGRGKAKAKLPIGHPEMVQWLQDGRASIGLFQPSAEGKATRTQVAFDLSSGTVVPISKDAPAFKPKEIDAALAVVLAPMQSNTGTLKKTLRSAWLKSTKVSDQGEYLLVPRADAVVLNAPLDAVAVLDQGVVTVRTLLSVPKETYLQAKNAADKARALSEVKQIGTAAHIFAADNDDRFPSQEEFQNKALSPYLKNDGFFDGFTYVFGGGSIANLKNPSGTMLGYKPVAGGFAVVFADSSARWLRELPKNP